MQNQYLEILGLEPGASKKEVKSAYRRLSKRYHPDVSADEDAKEKFIAINEAYTFLNRVGPRPHQETVNYDYDPFVSEYETWRQRARAKAEKRAREEELRRLALIKEMLKRFNYGAYVISLLSFVLLIDLLLPLKGHEEEIVGYSKIYEYYGRNRRVHQYDEVQFQSFTMRFWPEELSLKDYKRPAAVYATMILSKPVKAKFFLDDATVIRVPVFRFQRIFGFLVTGMLIGLALYFFFLKTPDGQLSVSIVMIFLFVISIFLFFKI